MQSSVSVSPRKPPPSPYASLTMQSGGEESDSGSGDAKPARRANGFANPMLAAAAAAAVAAEGPAAAAAGSKSREASRPVDVVAAGAAKEGAAKPQISIEEEGRSPSLENRTVSFDNWKVRLGSVVG